MAGLHTHRSRGLPAAARLGPALETLAPGVALCVVVALAGQGLAEVEAALFGRAWLEGLVLAILVGVGVRASVRLPPLFDAGIAFSGKQVLEVAVALLGAGVSTAALAGAGWPFLLGVALVVAAALPASYGLGRLLGLPHRMALLIACGNSICGNSAIAAAAPAIRAEPRDVAASIGFTAVLGVAVVLLLPLSIGVFGLQDRTYGVLAGLLVYAVPQVLAATAPVSALAVQVGTLTKLARVMMLGPVVMVLALIHRTPGRKLRIGALVPWFILAFAGLLGLRAAGALPEPFLRGASETAGLLTTLSMAALGLSVDLAAVRRAGLRAILAVSGSLLALGALAFVFLRLAPLG